MSEISGSLPRGNFKMGVIPEYVQQSSSALNQLQVSRVLPKQFWVLPGVGNEGSMNLARSRRCSIALGWFTGSTPTDYSFLLIIIFLGAFLSSLRTVEGAVLLWRKLLWGSAACSLHRFLHRWGGLKAACTWSPEPWLLMQRHSVFFTIAVSSYEAEKEHYSHTSVCLRNANLEWSEMRYDNKASSLKLEIQCSLLLRSTHLTQLKLL